MDQKPPAAPAEVAERAYQIWDAEGRPEGAALEHWLRAEAELAAEVPKRRGKKKATSAKPRARTSRKASGTKTKAASSKKATRKPASRSRPRRPRGTPPSP